ncbi:hypothetical protein [Hymenobacter canadensis]|uniref:Uncharacterized protein n=1 Tax=Hymenobacter canadensis TaxID=2999067 RepID=A0ABY7LXL9_9BACT|nr:hypothetical protein [Hymenobacter canadensis]WBA43688.1 hypothetical protein O3303_08985 [Hymenobacter canadensis]
MTTAAPNPFALVKTVVLRRCITLRHYLDATKTGTRALREARKQRKRQEKDARLRDFFGWCSGCEAYGSIF